MTQKRWTVTFVLMAVVLPVALVGLPGTALANGGEASTAAPPRHDLTHDGDQSDDDTENQENDADTPVESDRPGTSENPGDSDDSGSDASCTSVESAAPALGPVTVCVGKQPG